MRAHRRRLRGLGLRLSLLIGLVIGSAGIGSASPAAAMGHSVIVRVTIEQVRAIDTIDALVAADFFAKVWIDGQEFTSETIEDDDTIAPNWPFGKPVDLARGSIEIDIQVWDVDGLEGNVKTDISPVGGAHTLELTLNLAPCSVSGAMRGDCGVTLVSRGNDNDIVEITFRVEVAAPGLADDCPIHDYRGNLPYEAPTGWLFAPQGLAHDERHWFFSDTLNLIKVPIEYDGSFAWSELASLRRASMPSSWRQAGYNHFGDLDQSGGFLFAPITGKGVPGALGLFRADDLEPVDDEALPVPFADLIPAGLPAPNPGWVAIDHAKQLLYTSSKPISADANSGIYTFHLDLANLQSTNDLRGSLRFVRIAPVVETSGSPLGQAFNHPQGGAVTPWSDLYFSNGLAANDAHEDRGGVHLFRPTFNRDGEPISFRLIASASNGSDGLGDNFTYEYEGGFGGPLEALPFFEEPEGMDWWDLSSVPTAPGTLRDKGQLHVMLLDHDAEDLAFHVAPEEEYLGVDLHAGDDLYIKHYDVRYFCVEGSGPVVTLPDPSPAFGAIWARTDRPILEDVVDRTWIWGPSPFTDAMLEPYKEGPDGTREVIYYDKSRMEITHPDAVNDGLWYVTNGLLVVELITGRMQIGDAAFVQREPAWVNVAGDPGSNPTYAQFQPLLDDPPLPEGATITWRLTPNGTVDTEDAGGDLLKRGVTADRFVPETNHTIAQPFWEFMTSAGLVYEDGAYVEDALFINPFYATGFPITEAYWTTVTVLGTPTDVLVQCFERRCLTYTPDNPPGWQVEAGNVGQHYYRWRYGALPAD